MSRARSGQLGVHKNPQALERELRAWVDSWNAGPEPFAWTKTAEEILVIAAYSGPDESSSIALASGGRGDGGVGRYRHEAPDNKLVGYFMIKPSVQIRIKISGVLG